MKDIFSYSFEFFDLGLNRSYFGDIWIFIKSLCYAYVFVNISFYKAVLVW